MTVSGEQQRDSAIHIHVSILPQAFLRAQLVKKLPAMQNISVQIPGLGRSAGEGIGYPLQYSGLENSKDCILHGVPKSQTQLSDLYFHFHSPQRGLPNLPANAGDIEVSNFYVLGMGFPRNPVRKIPWRRAWQPTPVVLPGESHGQRSLAGYSL